MKRKMVFVLILTLFIFMIIMHVEQNLSEASNHTNSTRIPEKAVRLRILANSNSGADQSVKRQIRDAVNANVEKWVRDLKTIDQAKKVIRSHIGGIQKTVSSKLKSMNLDESFTVKLGEAKFPTKMYGGYVYPAGKYEALVITLGSGKGANWWCVLFPPLCFLDFDNGDAVKPDVHAEPVQHQTVDEPKKSSDNTKDKKDDVKVRFFLADVFTQVTGFFSGLFA